MAVTDATSLLNEILALSYSYKEMIEKDKEQLESFGPVVSSLS